MKKNVIMVIIVILMVLSAFNIGTIIVTLNEQGTFDVIVMDIFKWVLIILQIINIILSVIAISKDIKGKNKQFNIILIFIILIFIVSFFMPVKTKTNTISSEYFRPEKGMPAGIFPYTISTYDIYYYNLYGIQIFKLHKENVKTIIDRYY